MTALIVDDTHILRLVLKDILVKYCSIDETDIYETSSGIDAIKEYKTHKPDIVFLDIAMPDLDGKSVIGEILAYDAFAKVIMCTSSSDKNNIRECLNVGAIDYIVKPPRLDRVKQAVGKATELLNIENDACIREMLAQSEQGDTGSPAAAVPSVQSGRVPAQVGKGSMHARQAPAQVGLQNGGEEIALMKKEFGELKKEFGELKEGLAEIKLLLQNKG